MSWRSGGATLCWVLRDRLTHMATAEQRPEESEGARCVVRRRRLLEN